MEEKKIIVRTNDLASILVNRNTSAVTKTGWAFIHVKGTWKSLTT